MWPNCMWGGGRGIAWLPRVEGEPSQEPVLERAEPTRRPFMPRLSVKHILSGVHSVTLQGAVGRVGSKTRTLPPLLTFRTNS